MSKRGSNNNKVQTSRATYKHTWYLCVQCECVCVCVCRRRRAAASDPGRRFNAIKNAVCSRLSLCVCVSVRECLHMCVCASLWQCLLLARVCPSRLSHCCWILLPLLRFVWENSGRGNYMWNFDGEHEQANSSSRREARTEQRTAGMAWMHAKV